MLELGPLVVLKRCRRIRWVEAVKVSMLIFSKGGLVDEQLTGGTPAKALALAMAAELTDSGTAGTVGIGGGPPEETAGMVLVLAAAVGAGA